MIPRPQYVGAMNGSTRMLHRRATRSDKDYAIEHGRYLANAAGQFLLEQNRAAQAERLPDSEYWSALETAIYEFRKRAAKAEGKPAP